MLGTDEGIAGTIVDDLEVGLWMLSQPLNDLVRNASDPARRDRERAPHLNDF